MNHFIAMNPQRGGNKGSASCLPLAEYDKLIAQPWLHDMVEQIRGGNDKLKGLMPFRCGHYSRFLKNHRSQKDADPTSFLFQTTIDIDDKELVGIAIEMARQLNCSDSIWNGMLLHLEYSARKKLHIDIRMPIGMTIEETQRAYCKALGVPCDESCFTPERILFITDQDSEIYRSKDWYAVLPADELKARREAYLKRGLTIDGRRQQGTQPQPFNIQHSTFNTQQNIPDGLPTSGTASEKSLIAFDLFTESAGLKNVNIDTEGSRHSSLLAIMSAGASRVMSEEELRRVVAVKMPSFAQERDCLQLIHDFYEKYGDNTKPFSRDVIRINAQAETQANQLRINNEELRIQGASAGNQTVQSSNLNVQSSEDDYPAPPEMPKKLPKLVELLVSQTPDVYKPAVAHAIFPPLATHLCRTYFNYIDNVEHEATLMCCLLAGTGAGKNCVQMPINLIMEDIRKRDKDNLKREKEWKDEVTRKGANKDKRKRPENLVIQEIDADMTNPAFVMRTAEAQEHFLYTALNEIDQFDNLRGIGNQQFRIMCLAFDPGNQYGQTRVGTQSVTERVTIRFNWNASTTINKGIRYFSKVLTDGPISRINFCTIPEREIGAEMPVYGTYDDTFRENLKPYIEHLNMASGTINCPEAFALAQKLKEENADFARMSQDRVYENLSFRANVIAYLKACVLYVANGCQWESEIEEFVRWNEQYDLYCKMRFFRDAIVKSEQEGVKSSKRGPSNMLQLLPDEFSYQQAEQLRSDLGLDTKGTRRMIATWVFRKYIVKVEAGEQGVNAGNDKADNSHCNYNYGNYSFYRKLCFLKNESK
ncbi:hypothetical protein NND09_07845 [Prevotella copri]|jgi:hypothetical protein|uniref:DUF3987 domain-containing protein n=1 Tax=Segatella copri TaxID=165179 RepID=A0AAW4YLE2_9BACT|nr:hypothetical protein [Segatella copri]MCE4122101.1 hypothetical protein [Segatella copri]MCP9498467.1 hypothetical protein [Segatella copri]MCP9513438.1 hypothetical protein [Segatella copri]MCP9522273.1 hypothetical protein [Segatella copri]